ncbi:MAG TPA: hypothetical protein VFN97_01700 [Actinospica sp.]|nr:hypothetical protein [Actinospica sp.]
MSETIRIVGASDVITEIESLIRESDGSGVKYVRTDEVEADEMGADFILETIAAVVAIVDALFFDGAIVPRLFGILRRHHGTRIRVDTPTGKVTIEVTKDLSEEQLRDLLAAAIAVG